MVFEAQALGSALLRTKPCWWERTWIVQELVSARNDPIFLFGPCETSWTRLRKLVNIRGISSLKELPNDQVLAFTSSTVHGSHDVLDVSDWPDVITIQEKLPQCASDLVQAIDRFRSLREESLPSTASFSTITSLPQTACLDPRDQVYAFLGLVKRTEARLVPIDYNATTRRVYADTTYAAIKADRSLTILQYIRPKASMPGLPSWVVDFSTRVPMRDWATVGCPHVPVQYDPQSSTLSLSATRLGTVVRVDGPTDLSLLAPYDPPKGWRDYLGYTSKQVRLCYTQQGHVLVAPSFVKKNDVVVLLRVANETGAAENIWKPQRSEDGDHGFGEAFWLSLKDMLPEKVPQMDPLFESINAHCRMPWHPEFLHDALVPIVLRRKSKSTWSFRCFAVNHDSGDYGRLVINDHDLKISEIRVDTSYARKRADDGLRSSIAGLEEEVIVLA